MAPRNITPQIEEVSIEQAEPHQGIRGGRSPDLLVKLSHEVFKYDCLDRSLKRHHVTGNCQLGYPKGSPLILDRNRFLGRGWHWSLSNFRTDLSPLRPCGCIASILVRRVYNLRGYAVARRDGQCQTSGWSDHGLSGCIC